MTDADIWGRSKIWEAGMGRSTLGGMVTNAPLWVHGPIVPLGELGTSYPGYEVPESGIVSPPETDDLQRCTLKAKQYFVNLILSDSVV